MTHPPNSGVRGIDTAKLVYPAHVVLERWRTWQPRRSLLAQIMQREARWLDSGRASNCPKAQSPVDWDTITPDCSVVMVTRVETFFRLHPQHFLQRAAVMLGQPSAEFLAEWEAWYALNPVYRQTERASMPDPLSQAYELIELVREWNARNPNDPITYDGIRKAIQEKRLVTSCRGRPQKATLGEVAVWRAQTKHGGKREQPREEMAA